MNLEIPRDQIIFEKEIGHGEFGVVMRAIVPDLPSIEGVTSVAIKVLREGASQVAANEFIREGLRLQDLNHENVIRLLATCVREQPYMLVLEYMIYGDLKALLRHCHSSKVDLSLAHMLKFSLDVSHGFEYLQQKRFVHRDLAARNVLVSGTFVAKIGDFGLI